MTTKSIVELGSELAADLSLTELDNNSQQRCFASAQVISAILYAARSDELVEQLLPVAEGIISTTFRLLYSSRANSLRLRSALWQLLSASFHVWTSVAEGNSIMAHPVIVDRNPPLARCGEHLPRPRDVLEALSCLLGMYQDLCSRHMEVFATNLQAGIESAMHCYMSATDLSDYEVETFAAIVAKSPIVLELSQEGSKPTAVATKSILQHLAGRASHYVAAGKGTDWSLAGSMLRSTWLDVVSRIFASSYGRAQLLQTLKEGAIGDKRLHDLSLLRAPFPVEEQRRSSQIDNNTLSRLLNSTARFRVDDWICALSLLQHVSLVDSQHASPAVTFDDLQQLGQRLDSTMLAHEGVSTDSVEGIPRAWRQLCSLFEALVSDYCRRTRPTSANSRAAAASSDLASRGMSGSETHGPFSICLIKSVLTTLSLPGHLTFQETVLPGILNAARKNMHAGKLTSFALLALQQSIEAILTSPDDIYKSEYNELCVFAKKLRQLNHEKARELATALDWNTFMVRSDSSWSNALTKLAACTSHEQRNTLTKLIVGKLDKDVDNGTHALISTVLEEFHQQLDFEVAMNHMRLLHAIVFKSSRPKQEDLLPAQLVPGIVASFTERLPAVTSYKAFLYASSTLDLLLRYHTRSIDQHSIESILTSIFATSTAGPLTSDNNTTTQHNPSQALQNNVPKLYAHLTTLLQSILILHRRRLIDRSHLLLPPLQSLLRCLFAPPPSISSTKPPDFPTSQPSWLARQNPLTAENAASYARLLTTWADPSPSAVAPPRSKSRRSEGGAGKGKDESLVNHTMLARRHAGQFAPYILLELCRLQLEGRLVDESNVSSASASQGARLDGKGADEQDEDDYADEAKPQQARQSMRDALRPGVHALFDAMALVESGTDERGKRRAFVDVVARDEAGVWGVSAGVRTVLRSWWGEWRLERGLRG